MKEGTDMKVAMMEPTVIESQTPPEPPAGSVVLDPKGNAWQSCTLSDSEVTRWHTIGAGLLFAGLSWDVFITRCKSVTLIYTPQTREAP